MHFFFADGSHQRSPTRDGMGPLVAVGGVLVHAENLGNLEQGLGALCAESGFPENEEFKWSPGRDLWMRDNLVKEDRERFFTSALELAAALDVTAVVVIEDLSRSPATRRTIEHEMDATVLLLERVDNMLSRQDETGVVIVDRQGGGRQDDDAFLLNCLETLREGTDYTSLQRIPVNVLSAPSKFLRCLQLADLITGSTLALVGGEAVYSPPLFENSVLPLLYRDSNRVGGYGLKLHPDFVYANLYHWLVGDTHWWKGHMGVPLPAERLPYSDTPDHV